MQFVGFKNRKMTASAYPVVSLLMLLTALSCGHCLLCRQCDRTYTLDACVNTTTCGPVESCFIDELITAEKTIVYNAGCRAASICSILTSGTHSSGRRRATGGGETVSCSRCCDSPDCNKMMCGIKYRNTTTSPCFYCDSSKDDSDQGDVHANDVCRYLTTCQPDEMCSVRDLINTHRYTCMPSIVCRLSIQEALKRKEECANDPNPYVCGNHVRRDLDVVNNHVTEDNNHATEVNALRKRAEVCTVCCGDGYCNSGTCDQTLDRLYWMWKENLLDMNTLRVKATLPTTTATTTTTTTTMTSTYTTTTTTTTTTEPTTSTPTSTPATTTTTAVTPTRISTSKPTTATTKTPTTTQTTTLSSSLLPSTTTQATTTTVTLKTPTTAIKTTISSTSAATAAASTTDSAANSTERTATCTAISNCVRESSQLDQRPVCELCEPGFVAVNENHTCFDVSSSHDVVCDPKLDHLCYNFFAEQLSWNDAKAVCYERRGLLFVPERLEEEMFIEKYLQALSAFKGFDSHMFWIGGQSQVEEEWLETKNPAIQRWTVGITSPDAQCAAISGPDGFYWIMQSCDRTSFFICKETQIYHPPPLLG